MATSVSNHLFLYQAQNRRRPAGLYLPAWVGGSPAALDFAVTAPQRQGTLARAAETALAAATDYSDRKREHQGTKDLCRAVGVTFVPMVAETTGAWAPEATAVFRHIASATSAASGRDARDILQEILEGAAVCIRRANARTELRRARDEVGGQRWGLACGPGCDCRVGPLTSPSRPCGLAVWTLVARASRMMSGSAVRGGARVRVSAGACRTRAPPGCAFRSCGAP